MKIGERIKIRRLELGLSVDELAEKIDKNRATVYRYENNEIEKLPITVIEPLARALNVPPSYLFGLKDETEENNDVNLDDYDNIRPITTKKIPLLGEIACGEPLFAEEDRESYIEIGTDIKADFCLRAVGDSMIGARIHDGDIVFIRRQETVDDGQVAAVIIEGEATLKRVFYTNGQRLVLQAENNAFPPLVFENEDLNGIRIIGKAIAFQSDVI